MIDNYSFGRIVVDGKEYTEDIIIYPDHVQDDWWRSKGHELGPEDVRAILKQKPEVLIIGTGRYGCLVLSPKGKALLEENKVKLYILPTEKACDVYNKNRNKRTIAALHITC